MDLLLILAICFFLGSFPTAYILVKRIFQKDIRRIGSGNPGMMNVLDNFGKRYAYFVGTIDILKGIIAVSIAKLYSPNETLAVLAGLTAIAGHDFTPFLKFKGGNGVATAGGAVLALMPFASGIACMTGLITAIVVKSRRFGGNIAVILVPIMGFYMNESDIFVFGSALIMLSIVLKVIFFEGFSLYHQKNKKVNMD
ncbi:MAG: glycerol-3-phosphate acyltransferase [Dehalococcoidia bacterium]|tara:strand:- start:7188 stop:7778 length:591 start_codon:yes stop_codon:yes gene_type:complete